MRGGRPAMIVRGHVSAACGPFTKDVDGPGVIVSAVMKRIFKHRKE